MMLPELVKESHSFNRGSMSMCLLWTRDKTRNTVEGYDRDVMTFFCGKDVKSYEVSTRTTHDKKLSSIEDTSLSKK